MNQAVKDFLEKHGYGYTREKDNGELIARCPLPSHADRNPSFAINSDTGMWNCLGCNSSGTFDTLYSLVLDVPYFKAIDDIKARWGIDVRLQKLFKLPQFREQTHLFEGISDVARFYNGLERGPAPTYYLDRGFTDADWEEWEGADYDNSLSFPVRTLTGEIVAVQRRKYKGNLRYVQVEGSKPKKTLYGIHKAKFITGGVVVCEGLLDVHRLYRIFVNKIVREFDGRTIEDFPHLNDFLTNNNDDMVSMLSASAFSVQIELLCLWDEITLWLDNDEAGKNAQLKLAERLIALGKKVFIINSFSEAKDQADKNFIDLAIVASLANRMSWLRYKYKL